VEMTLNGVKRGGNGVKSRFLLSLQGLSDLVLGGGQEPFKHVHPPLGRHATLKGMSCLCLALGLAFYCMLC